MHPEVAGVKTGITEHHGRCSVVYTVGEMEDSIARGAYQIFLYALLFTGTAAIGGFVGYIASFLYHESRKDGEGTKREDDPEEGASRSQVYR